MISLKHRFTQLWGAAAVGALAISAPATVLLAPAAPAAAQATGQLQRAASALRAITTLRADFTQTDRNGQALNGTLTLRNPGRIRFQYAEGVNMLVVSNGSTLSVIDYDVQQVERWPIRNSPLGALLDPNRDISRYGRVMPTSAPNVVSIQVEDPNRPEIPQITLIFVEKAGAPGGLELTSWVALDAQNNRTTVRLRNHRYGTSVPDSMFTFRDPRASARRP
ncbi:MAG: outer membrane lipoprotein carrier protein LolA [Alteraurantiacibacter sp.]